MKYFEIDTMPAFDRDFVFIENPPEGTRASAFQMAVGEPMAADYPADARIYLTDKHPGLVLPSLIGNVRSFLIVARPVKEVFEAARPDAVEYLPFTLYNHTRRVASRDYFIVNPLGSYDCVDWKASTVRYSPTEPEVILRVTDLVLDPRKLAKAPELFRIDRQPRRYVISQRLGKKLVPLAPSNFIVTELQQA
jgi:hypothetical protein